MIVYKLFPVRKDGSIGPLFINTANPAAGSKMMLAKESFLNYNVQMLRNNY